MIRTERYWEEVVEWLQVNVGPLQWSKPIVEWKGQGWTMKAGREVAQRGAMGRAFYLVKIDDPHKATWFGLWS